MADDHAPIQHFKYESQTIEKSKKVSWLCKTDHLFAASQVIRQGGETNLHAHPSLDGFWFVLAGRARFYSDETTIAFEAGQFEGVLVPRGTPYWFESVGDEQLEMIQVEASSKAFTTEEALFADRVDYNAPKRQIDPSAIG